MTPKLLISILFFICKIDQYQCRSPQVFDDWLLVANKKECIGSEIEINGLPSIEACSDKCRGRASMFAFGTNDYGTNRCDNDGCRCLCETSATDGICTQTDHAGYRLYKYVRQGCTGGDSCCSNSNKCFEDEGDCDSDSDCQDGLICGLDNCSNKRGQEWDSTDDCCYKPECETGCTFEYAPVCGSDETTYPNECSLKLKACRDRSNLAVSYSGECINNCQTGCTFEYAPVCGSDGETYSNECSLKSKACKDRSNLAVAYSGECSKKTGCPCDAPTAECIACERGITVLELCKEADSRGVWPSECSEDMTGWQLVSSNKACTRSSDGEFIGLGTGDKTLGACKERCEGDENCVAIDWFTTTQWCNTLSKQCSNFPTSKDGASNYAFHHGDCVRKDYVESCPDWVTCCPGGDGSEANCDPSDCSSAPGVPCAGFQMADLCPATCDCAPALRTACQCKMPMPNLGADWCWLEETPCKMLTGTIASDDDTWARCSHNGKQQVNCTDNGLCECTNPFAGTRNAFKGNPDALCGSGGPGFCYVNCNGACGDQAPAASPSRCQSTFACQVHNGQILGDEEFGR